MCVDYEIDATTGRRWSAVTRHARWTYSKDILRSGGTDRYHLELIDALFNVENTATVQGVEIELLFTEDRDIGRISK